MLNKNSFPIVYAVKHKDFEVRMASRSGGIFTALSDDTLKSGGVVYGCVLDEDFMAVHVRAENEAERNKMRGSKYIQSDMANNFIQVKKDLESGRRVLFSGTSCQIAGLKGFLRKDYDNLICVDIICHGVPSPLVWQEYLNWQSSKYGDCTSVDFRNKKDFGWKAHIETLWFRNPKGKERKISSHVFKTVFYGHRILRPCCYECPYKDTMHPADITIADYWGIDKAAPGFSDNKGVSLVLVNNDKGTELFERISDGLELKKCRLEDSMQPPMIKPFDAPADRKEAWEYFYSHSFSDFAVKYGGNSLKKRFRRAIGGVARKIFSK